MEEQRLSQNSSNEEEDIPFVETRPPTEREKFYLSLGPEIIKNSFNLTNELLKQQISICTALIGASIIFQDILSKSDNKTTASSPKLQFIVAIFFFLGLITAFIGLIPFSRENVCLDSPSAIESFHKDAISHKRLWYYISSVCIFIGLLFILVKLYHLAFD